MTIEVGERVAAPVAPVKSVPDVLRGALHLIEEFGWIQGGYGTREAGYCLVGALTVAADSGKEWTDATVDVDPRHPAYKAYMGARSAVRGFMLEDPEAWNDRHRRTREQVLTVLRAAADACEAR